MKNLRLYSSHQDIDGIKIGNTVIAFEDGSKPIYTPITPIESIESIESNGVINWDMCGDNQFVLKRADGTIIYCKDNEELRHIDVDYIADTLYVNIKPTNENEWETSDDDNAKYFSTVKFYPYTYPYRMYPNYDAGSCQTTKIYLYGMDGDDAVADVISNIKLNGGSADVYYNNEYVVTINSSDRYVC